MDPWFLTKVDIAKSGDSVFQFRDDVLCKLVADVFCPVLPKSDVALIDCVLADLHSSALGGHVGPKKLLKLCQKRFYWPNMNQDVVRFCKHCISC